MDLIRHGPCARMTHTVAHMAQEKGVTAIVAFAFCPFLGFALTNVIEHLVLLFPPNKHAFTAKAVWADFSKDALV